MKILAHLEFDGNAKLETQMVLNRKDLKII